MKTILYNPNNWLDQFFSDVEKDWKASAAEKPSFAPTVDVAEVDNAYILKAELPGVAKENIKIEVRENRLILSGSKESHIEKKEEGKYYYSEARSGNFSRSFDLPRHVQADAITAENVNGVLTVKIPKAQDAQPKAIEIK